jgi:DNA-binding transcriptional regulator YiaG
VSILPLGIGFRHRRPIPQKPLPEGLAGALLAYRRQHGLTQKELAAHLGINGWTVLLWEKGSQPSLRMQKKLKD